MSRGGKKRARKKGDNVWINKDKKPRNTEANSASTSAEGERPDNGVWIKQRSNEAFSEYYKSVGVVPEDEWDLFYATLQKPLPTTFRITTSNPFAGYLRNMFKNEIPAQFTGLVVDGEVAVPPTPITWYPDEYGWYFDMSRSQLRKSESLKKFWAFLVSITEEGYVSRQEAVSMIPPLFLDVQSHHKILDMCAAPGSKTAQLMEMLHQDLTSTNLPAGSVVANDLDNKRCYMLIHQTNRLSSPSLVVTNHEASNYPNFLLQSQPPTTTTSSSSSSSAAEPSSSSKPAAMTHRRFDRILCDVPCSGDGTLRKNMDLWQRWVPTLGLGIHNLQVSIAKRGMNLLEVGGKLVYSTCSLNPVEDEAVVAEILRFGQGAIELLDVSSLLPGLKRSNGLSKWRIFDKDRKWFEKHDDLDEFRRKKIPSSCFPPSSEEASSFHLERCVRILPHFQDTGGFFIALLQKTAEIPGYSIPDTIKPQPPVSYDRKKGRNRFVYSESPFIPLSGEWTPAVEKIREFYGLTDDFPISCLMTRSEKSPTIYFVSPGCKEVLEAQKTDPSIKVIHTGLKLFQKRILDNVRCDFRACAEGLPYLLPYITQRRLTISLEDLHVLFKLDLPKISEFSDELVEQLQALDVGSAVITANLNKEHLREISLPIWRAKASVGLFVAKKEKVVLKKLIFNEDAPIEELASSSSKDKEEEEGDNPEDVVASIDKEEENID